MYQHFASDGKRGHSQDERWGSLTSTQRTALQQLHHYGYRLLMVNNRQGHPFAVVANGLELAVLDPSGNMSFDAAQLMSVNR